MQTAYNFPLSGIQNKPKEFKLTRHLTFDFISISQYLLKATKSKYIKQRHQTHAKRTILTACDSTSTHKYTLQALNIHTHTYVLHLLLRPRWSGSPDSLLRWWAVLSVPAPSSLFISVDTSQRVRHRAADCDHLRAFQHLFRGHGNFSQMQLENMPQNLFSCYCKPLKNTRKKWESECVFCWIN